MADKVAATYHPNACPAVVAIDFDSINCTLPHGHDGMHICHGEGGRFYWVAIR